jgi:hypothetical protein
MKKAGLALILIVTINQFIQAQSLGNYPAVTIATSGGNGNVIPSTQPANTTNIIAYTTGNFKGLLLVSPTTGVVTITDARPAGIYNITVKAFNGATTAIKNFALTVNNPACSQALFSGNTNVIVGSLPFSVAVGDFNGDGNQDIATANYGFNTVSIRLGDGSGSFFGTTNIAVGTNPQAIAIGDFNGDGNQDLAVSNFVSFNVTILMGNGAGGFSFHSNVVVGSYPYSIATGDFNNDGKQDFATANYGSNTVSISMGNGNGGFSGTTNVAVGNGPRSIIIGDFNGDGNQDLATANYNSNNISIRLGDGLGGFSGTTNIAVGVNPHSIAIGDFNGDGKQDLASANITDSSVSIRLGNGLGNFSGITEVRVGTNPRAITIGDFNGDGKADLATANYSSNTISIRLGNGLGSFYGNTAVPVNNSPFSIAIGDFNNDGKQDLVSANAGSADISIRLGTVNEINVQGNNINIADADNTPDAADFTDFGNVSSNLIHNFTIKNTSTVNLVITSINLTGTDPSMFTLGNINLPVTIAGGGSANFTLNFIPTSEGLKTATVNIINDNCDKAVYDFSVQGMGVPVVQGLGNYPASTITAGGNGSVIPSAAPSNAENITAYTTPGFKGLLQVDVVTGIVTITNAHPAGIYIIKVKANGVTTAISSFILTVNNAACSQGLFSATPNVSSGQVARSVAIGDFNGDNKQDLATANYSANTVSIRLGDGTGNFSGIFELSVGTNPASVVIGDFNGDGKPDIATANSSSNDISIRLGNGSGGFSGTTNIIVGNTPLSIATGDFNNDGKLDLVTANSNSNDVSIRLGDGLGGFIGTTNVMAGNSPRSVIVGDFNSDGKPDIATANYGDNTISIFLGDGSGGLNGINNVSVGNNPNSVALSDFNNDGKQDLASVNYTDNSVSISFGDGNGGFSGTFVVPVESAPFSIAAGDFNGDGKPDLATANYSANSISIRLGNTSGGFSGTTNLAAGYSPQSVAIGDFNNDGKQDIVTANSGSSDLSIRLGNENEINVKGNNLDIADADNTPVATDHTDFGNVSSYLIHTFTIQNTSTVDLRINSITLTGTDTSLFTINGINLPVTIAGGGYTTFTVTFIPTSAGLKTAIVNINNDNCEKGVYDFAVQGTGIALVSTLGIYPSTIVRIAGGNISVTPSVAPTNVEKIAAYTSTSFKGQLQVDALTGLVTITNAHPAGTYTIKVKAYGLSTAISSFLLTVNNTNCSEGHFSGTTNVNVGNLPYSVAIGDFNKDGKQDIATANYFSNSISIRLGDGYGNFFGNTDVNVGSNPYSIAIADFNGDGNQDLAVANHNSSNVSIRLGDGAGGFSGNTDVNVGPVPTFVSIGDFNGDGKKDIATSIIGNNSVSVRFGDGAGNFYGTTGIPVGSGPFSIAIGDFNGDGNQDIASANYNNDNITIYLGNGFGSFSSTSYVDVGINPYSITIGDFNGDGKQDLATANYNSNNVSICLGDGAGNFSLTTNVMVGNGPGSLAIGDFNGDGNQDLATSNYTSGTVSIRLGNGAGDFSGTSNIVIGTGPESIAIGDFNSDGKQDLAVAVNSSNSVSIRLGSDKEINVQGNNISIADADNTPDTSDNTDFGITDNVTHSFSIQNTGTGNLVINNIAISGTDAALFTISGISLPASIAGGSSTSFMVSFVPTYTGQKFARININNDDCDESIYDFAVKGEFECAQVVINFTGLANSLCLNSPAVTLTGNMAQGALFMGAGITNNANGTAVFDPVSAGLGLHTILYTYTDVNGCSNSYSQTVMVNAIPNVSFSGLATSNCTTDAVVILTGNHAPSGIFSGPGITDNGNGTASFDPAIAGAGIQRVVYSYATANGCINTSLQQVTVTVCPTTITLNLKMFLQGYYTGGNSMQPVLNNQSVPLSLASETDTITVELHDPVTFALVDSKQAVLLTDGTVPVTFTQPEGDFYIAIRHRNTIQTWSADPVSCTTFTPLYDFSSAANKAMGSNQAEVEPGVWAFFTGDINQDEFIDGNDFPEFDNDSYNGVSFEYNSTDMNGDGFVDGNDFPVFDNNSFYGASSIHP